MASFVLAVGEQDVTVRRVPGYPKARLTQFFCPITSITSIVELPKWLHVNPRRAQRTVVHAGIKETIIHRPRTMVIKNAGLTISALNAEETAGGVRVEFSKKDTHGLIDGNNTREAIACAVADVESDGGDRSDCFVEVSVYTGMNREEVTHVASGQNIRKTVQKQSLLNFTGYFDEIKTSLGDRAEEIIYYEGDTGDMDVKFLIQILESVNVLRYPDEDKNPMLYAHTGKCMCVWEDGYDVEDDENDPSESQILATHAKEILEVYEELMRTIPILWSRNGKWGSVANNAYQAIGLAALQAFRPVVKMSLEKQTFELTATPSEVLKACGDSIVRHIKDAYQEKGKGSDNVGKNTALYTLLYNAVYRWAAKRDSA